MKITFLDGYNILNSWPCFCNLKNDNLENLRTKLIDMIENYAHFKEEKIIIVFDAHLIKKMESKIQKGKYIEIVFTKEGETADSYIEKSVDELGRKLDVSVVTSDYLEQQTIFQRGATRKSSIEFYKEVSLCNKDIEKKIICLKNKNSKNSIEDKLDSDVFELLDKMRKEKKI